MFTTRQAGKSQGAALQAPQRGGGARASRAALKGLSFGEGEAQLAPSGRAAFEMTPQAGGDRHVDAGHPDFDVDTLRAGAIEGRLGADWARGGMPPGMGGPGAGLPGLPGGGGLAGMPGLGAPGMGIPGMGDRLGGAGGGFPTGVPGLGGPGRFGALGGSLAGVLNGFGGGPRPGKELPTGGFGADPRLAAGGGAAGSNGATSAEMLAAMAAGQAWGTAEELEGDAMQEIGRAVLSENPGMTSIQRVQVKQQFDLEGEITAEENEAVTAAAEAVSGSSSQGSGSGSQSNGGGGSTTSGSTSDGGKTGENQQGSGSGTTTSDSGTTTENKTTPATDTKGADTPNPESSYVAGGVKDMSRADRIKLAVNNAKFGGAPDSLSNPGPDGAATTKKQGRERLPRSTKLDTLILKEGGDTTMPGIATGRRPLKGGGIRPPNTLTQPGGPDTTIGQPTLGGQPTTGGDSGRKPDD